MCNILNKKEIFTNLLREQFVIQYHLNLWNLFCILSGLGFSSWRFLMLDFMQENDLRNYLNGVLL